jgi:hypothetical protein
MPPRRCASHAGMPCGAAGFLVAVSWTGARQDAALPSLTPQLKPQPLLHTPCPRPHPHPTPRHATRLQRLLDDQEAAGLLGAGALALHNCRVAWPLLVPVHDPLRDAYRGVARVGPCSVRWVQLGGVGG